MPGLLHKAVTGFQSERTLLKLQAFRAGRQPLYNYSALGRSDWDVRAGLCSWAHATNTKVNASSVRTEVITFIKGAP